MCAAVLLPISTTECRTERSLLDANKMAAVEVIEDVGRIGATPISQEDINEETKKLAEEIKEKANTCFKSSDSK